MAVKIDTNGLNPTVVARLVDRGLVDYVAERHQDIAAEVHFVGGGAFRFSRVIETVGIVKNSGLD